MLPLCLQGADSASMESACSNQVVTDNWMTVTPYSTFEHSLRLQLADFTSVVKICHTRHTLNMTALTEWEARAVVRLRTGLRPLDTLEEVHQPPHTASLMQRHPRMVSVEPHLSIQVTTHRVIDSCLILPDGPRSNLVLHSTPCTKRHKIVTFHNVAMAFAALLGLTKPEPLYFTTATRST